MAYILVFNRQVDNFVPLRVQSPESENAVPH